MPSRPPASLLALLIITGCAAAPEPSTRRPNIIVVMSDDQGFGDFGFQGNQQIETPNLDAMAARSARLETFYVHPVCTPTRAALMTGRHPQRTRAFDTWIGRAMMDPQETTIAELLRAAGYATGIFGKWHLGDCYPMRACDQGFDLALVHRGGGIGQPADPEGGEGRYTNPILFRNGVVEQADGYCTDVYFREAIDWMKGRCAAGQPFFCYLPTNAPHGPFDDVPPVLYQKYRARFPDADRRARIFAMIENIDQNIGRLFTALEDMEATRDTLVLFLVDNGPNGRRYVGPFRGMKSEVFEGGVRSPLLAHWPGTLAPGQIANPPAADFDLLPTLLEACGLPCPEDLGIDGESQWPYLTGSAGGKGADRTLVIQAHRGDAAVRYHNFLARRGRWKLVNASGFGREVTAVEPAFALFDLDADPGETRNLAAAHPDVVEGLVAAYDAWFDNVCTTRPDNFAPPPIHLGGPQAQQVTLTRQDWRRIGNAGGWGGRSRGVWHVRVVEEGPWRAVVRFPPNSNPVRARIVCGQTVLDAPIPDPAMDRCTFDRLRLPRGHQVLEIALEDDTGAFGPYQVFLERY